MYLITILALLTSIASVKVRHSLRGEVTQPSIKDQYIELVKQNWD